jgi:hypothetical protein
MVCFNAHLPVIIAQRSQARFKKIARKHQLINLGMKFVYRGIIGLRWLTASFIKSHSHILNWGRLLSPNLG